jgi:hypothetical protein
LVYEIQFFREYYYIDAISGDLLHTRTTTVR